MAAPGKEGLLALIKSKLAGLQEMHDMELITADDYHNEKRMMLALYREGGLELSANHEPKQVHMEQAVAEWELSANHEPKQVHMEQAAAAGQELEQVHVEQAAAAGPSPLGRADYDNISCRMCRTVVAYNLIYGVCQACKTSYCASCDKKNPGDWGIDNSCLQCARYVCSDCTYKFLKNSDRVEHILSKNEGNDSGTEIFWYEFTNCWVHHME